MNGKIDVLLEDVCTKGTENGDGSAEPDGSMGGGGTVGFRDQGFSNSK